MSVRWTLPLVFCATAVILSAIAGARGLTDQQHVYRVGVDLIQLDVSVLDRQLQPVVGLTPSDFTVTENGQRQSAQTFAWIDLPQPASARAAWTREAAPDMLDNAALSANRLVVILMDDAMVPADPAMVSSAKAIAAKAIDQLGAADLASVIFTRDNRHGQEFTRDRTRLRAAAATFQSAGHDPMDVLLHGPRYEASFAFDSIGVLRRLTQILGTVSDRRKTVIWISVGLPASLEGLADPASPMHQLFDEIKSCIEEAERGNVNIFPVDPGGLDGVRFYLSRRAQAMSPADMRNATTAGIDNQTSLAGDYRSLLQTIADDTGGHAFVNSNEFATKVAQIFRETGSFYLLGYASTNLKRDGLYRRIQVKVDRKDVSVRVRGGYFAQPADNIQAARSQPSAAMQAIADLVPQRDLPLSMTAAPFAGVNGLATVAVTLGLVRAQPAGTTDQVDIIVTAINDQGVVSPPARLAANMAAPGDSDPSAFQVLSTLSLPPGRYQLRAAAHSAALGKTGSVYLDVDVPDFARFPLSLSGVTLHTKPDQASSPANAFAAFLSTVPTVSRTFGKSEQVGANVRVYQRTAAPMVSVAVHIKIVDEHDAILASTDQDLPADQFSGFQGVAVDYSFLTSSLKTGEYLLTIDADGAGAKAHRDVRFAIR